MSRASTGTSRPRVVAPILAAAASLLLSCGLWRGAAPPEPPAAPPPYDRIEVPAPPPSLGPAPAGPPAEGPVIDARPAAPVPGAVPPAECGPADGTLAPPGGAFVEPPVLPAPGAAEGGTPGVAGTPAEPKAGPSPPVPETRGSAADLAARTGTEPAGGPAAGPAAGATGTAAPRAPADRPGPVVVARLPDHLAFDQSGPCWTRTREELAYRVELLGVTMGYARFVFNGKVLLGGREAYHLTVRAWTANVLALIYPINDTIDYYMDAKTLEPLRQEYTSANRKKNDVAIYDQETGRIVYRYRDSGKIRKQVDAVPNVYDPVTLAYLFRSREPRGDEKGQHVYAGRKVWEISARLVGAERIATPGGEVDTVVVRPVIKRDGKLEDKGDLRMWMTRDERRVPVRIYAKFKKIRTWTLVGELMPDRKGG